MAVLWRRPSVDTKFHIDLGWWEEQDRDIRVAVREALCDSCSEMVDGTGDEIDWVDEQTAQVTRVDPLWHSLRSCCSLKSDYIEPNTTVIDAVFRTFVANGNQPLTIQELYELLDRRPPATLLRLLTAGPVYMGIRPVFD